MARCCKDGLRAPCLRSVWGTALVRHPLYRRKIKESLGKEQRNESAKSGLKPQAPPLEKGAASTVLRSSHHQHHPPEPSQQLLSLGKSHQPTQDPRSRNSCAPFPLPRVGTGNGALSRTATPIQPEWGKKPISLFIYSFQSSLLRCLLWVTRRRNPAQGQWHLDRFCLVLIQLKPRLELMGGSLN